jgi:hypothetical protein
MISTTKILRKLTEEEILKLKLELNNIDHLWSDHSQNQITHPTALKTGKTVHLNSCSNKLVFESSILKTLPDTNKIISDIVGSNHIGRAYWHRLMPENSINFHTDGDIEFVKDNKLIHRYQIYLECTSENIIILDGTYKNSVEFEYSVVDFALTNIHYYKNWSSLPWYLLVFDAVNQPLS